MIQYAMVIIIIKFIIIFCVPCCITEELPEPVRANINEVERIICDDTPVALSFVEAWVYTQRDISWWIFIYTGSGTETPKMANFNRHKTMLIQALPENAKFISLALLERTRTSRYQMAVQTVNRKRWLAWSAHRKEKNKPISMKYLQLLGIVTDHNSTINYNIPDKMVSYEPQMPPVNVQSVGEAERIMISITPSDLTFLDAFAYCSRESKWWQFSFAGNKNNKPCEEALEHYETLFQNCMPKCGKVVSFGVLYSECASVRRYQLIVHHVAESQQ